MKIYKGISHICIWIVLVVFAFFKATNGYEVSWNDGIKYFLSFSILVGLFYIINYWSLPSLIQGEKRQWVFIPFFYIVGFVLLEIIWCISRIKEYYERYYMSFSWQECIFPREINGVDHISIIAGLVVGMLLSIGLAFLLIKIKRSGSNKKILSYLNAIFILICLLMTVTFIILIATESFKRLYYQPTLVNSQINFCSPKDNINSIQDILKQCQLDSKPTYVTFWTGGCAWLKNPVIMELEKLKTDSIRKHMNFLYIRGETIIFPSDFDSWEKDVEDNKITGVHIFLQKQLFEHVFVKQYNVKDGVVFGYSMLFGKGGTLILENAPKANESEKNKLIDLLNKWTNKTK